MLLLSLFATFFFAGIAEPGYLQRVIGTVLVGATLTLAQGRRRHGCQRSIDGLQVVRLERS